MSGVARGAVLGLAVGLLVVALGVMAELVVHGADWRFASVVRLVRTHPVLWILSLAPAGFGALGWYAARGRRGGALRSPRTPPDPPAPVAGVGVYERILGGLPDTVFLLDREGRIRWANDATEALLGHRPGMLRRVPLIDLLQPVPETGQRSSDGPGVRQLTGRHAGGTEVPLQAWVLDDEEGGEIWIVRKALPPAPRAVSDSQLRLDHLEAANRAKDAFLASMGQELRTPMNAIIGYAEVMREDLVDVDAQHFAPDLDKILTAARHLLALVDSVIDIASLESDTLEVHLGAVLVEDVVGAALQTIRPLATANRNAVAAHVDGALGSAELDGTRVRQILVHLLGNACRSTVDGTVRLDVAPSGDRLRFVVADDGIGMTEQEQARIFDGFAQADSGTRARFDVRASGLHISRRLARVLGGDLRVTSAPGRGSTFELQLPHRPVAVEGAES